MFGGAICKRPGISEELRQCTGRSELTVRDGKLTFLRFGNLHVELSNRTEEAGAQEKGLGGEYKCENVYLGILP